MQADAMSSLGQLPMQDAEQNREIHMKVMSLHWLFIIIIIVTRLTCQKRRGASCRQAALAVCSHRIVRIFIEGIALGWPHWNQANHRAKAYCTMYTGCMDPSTLSLSCTHHATHSDPLTPQEPHNDQGSSNSLTACWKTTCDCPHLVQSAQVPQHCQQRLACLVWAQNVCVLHVLLHEPVVALHTFLHLHLAFTFTREQFPQALLLHALMFPKGPGCLVWLSLELLYSI